MALLASGPFLIRLILSAGKGSKASEGRSALISSNPLLRRSLPALLQISQEEVGKEAQQSSVTGIHLCNQVKTLVEKPP